MKPMSSILATPEDEYYARNSKYARPADSYQTQLSSDEEAEFRKWAKKNKVPYSDSKKADYDMRGFWKAAKTGDPRAASGINANDGRMHFSDYWKTPYHESFSVESQWATPMAPRWNEEDQLILPDGSIVFDERAKAKRK